MSTDKTSKINLYTAISLVISSMIGTGVFTSLGYQLLGIQSVFAIICLWIVGGIVAIFGALNYGELASAMPRSGGEYNYLTKIYHPLVGFVSGFVSATVGFAAPVALSAMAFASYFNDAVGIGNEALVAFLLIAVLTLAHSFRLSLSSKIQNIATILNVVLIIIFIVVGLTQGANVDFKFTILPSDIKQVFSSSFAISLVYVSYAYSGWNAAIYIAGEIAQPEKKLTKALTSGAGLVMMLYVLLNLVFLLVAPIASMQGQKDVGYVAAHYIFGVYGSKVVALMICVALVSSVSSYIVFGPKVIQVLGEDYKLFRIFTKKNYNGVPIVAIATQSGIALLLIVTSSFESVLSFIGITLSLFTTLVVLGVLLNRITKKIALPHKTIGIPFISIVFLLIEFWMIAFALKEKTKESLIGLAIILAGIIIYFIVERYQKKALS